MVSLISEQATCVLDRNTGKRDRQTDRQRGREERREGGGDREVGI